MFRSIVDDIQTQFRTGNMITRLIILNIGIWAVMALLKSFSPADSSFYPTLVEYLAIPGDPMTLLLRPWTIITHMFIHADFWHVFWNMIILYWFGRIVGDLVGDKHILPVYFAGGMAGALAYLVSHQLMPGVVGPYALGASAAVMALVMAAGRIAPDYLMHLILIGAVKLKFIVLALVFFDLLGAGGSSNTGGHIAHLAGVAMGWYFVSQMGSRGDLSSRFGAFAQWLGGIFAPATSKPAKKGNLTVKYKSDRLQKTTDSSDSLEQQVDGILEKIKVSGFESLTKEEREILARASQK